MTDRQLGVAENLEFIYNADNKLHQVKQDSSTIITLKYDPLGNRVSKKTTAGIRHYVVDRLGRLPVILMELDSSYVIQKTYVYSNSSQILAQYNGSMTDGDKYFYLHDRLGSVRQVIDTSGSVEHLYSYAPFGTTLENDTAAAAPANPFLFTGQFYDPEISQYYLRARQYDPHIMRFTARDPVQDKFIEPVTFHLYLYCGNDPVNRIDTAGTDWEQPKIYSNRETWEFIDEVTDYVWDRGFPQGSFDAFGPGGTYDVKGPHFRDIFTIGKVSMNSGDFGNYLTAYVNTYLYRGMGELGTRIAGHALSRMEYETWDDLASRYFISAGVLQAATNRRKEGTWGNGINSIFADMNYAIEKLRFNSMSIERMCEVSPFSGTFDQRTLEATQFWNTTSWY